ncbi:hypothetical protein [Campylobacter insulaenigrae]|uniref:Uncharacterized protein n=1 Tax=Campylobacter insulaenigrae NCTC 12927 TaxID=1031564 RepID=A0A0A8H0X2_9BACT|nr:hypothetical protein [Campylobacter insulaenigrae]AJC87552.1 hypothetical protein CINS_0579 [Campylobacter insulaenigrae NCTC 12927]MCR6578380.1 hypothetical protein [Campylobacter insulaenigrae]MCR6591892.1 hypothetical protein [Campylobacter insulaenigrae]MCR6593379.1 hypothetical protein [Campylobacter insulaenigrae]MCR6594380.1 hypothetical protein [Campylobacter insulaenigrae]
MVKNLILSFGRTILDIVVIISFALALIYSIAMMFMVGFIFGLMSLLGSFIALFMSFFVIYLVIDIRDSLVNKTHE